MEKTLYNGYSDNCCAYCKLHNCGMTAKQMKQKECLRKQCWHLVKNKNHQYWRQREAIKQKRNNRKTAITHYVINLQVQAK